MVGGQAAVRRWPFVWVSSAACRAPSVYVPLCIHVYTVYAGVRQLAIPHSEIQRSLLLNIPRSTLLGVTRFDNSELVLGNLFMRRRPVSLSRHSLYWSPIHYRYY